MKNDKTSDYSDAVQNLLLENEKILWIGRPSLKMRLSSADIFMLPFSIIWFVCVLSMCIDYNYSNLYNMTSQFKMHVPAVSLFIYLFVTNLLFIPFLLVGCYFLIGWRLRARKKKKTMYFAITDKRLFCYSRFRKERIEETDIKDINDISVSYRQKDGIGTLVIDSESEKGQKSENRICFRDIEDARHVYEILSSAADF